MAAPASVSSSLLSGGIAVPKARWCAGVTAALVSCSPAGAPEAGTGSPPGAVTLVEVGDEAFTPPVVEDLGTRIALTDAGLLAMGSRFDTDPGSVRVFDRQGSVIARFARSGGGPGEVQFLCGLFGGSEMVTIYDCGQLRFLQFHADGTHRGTVVVAAPLSVLALRGDSIDAVIDTPTGSEIVRRHLRSQAGRVLLPRGDSTVLAWRGEGVVGRPVGFATFADGRVVVLDPLTYQIQFYDEAGRRADLITREVLPRLPTPREVSRFAERAEQNVTRPFYGPDGRPVDIGQRPTVTEQVEQYRDRPLPHFLGLDGGVWTDSRDRLWVVGQANDSTWVDLFVGTNFVRRWTLPCAGSDRFVRTAMGGGYLALVCEAPDDGREAEAMLRIYEIREGTN